MTLLQSGGKCFVIGPGMTLRSFSGEAALRIDNRWRSCTIKPEKRLNVRGRRTVGDTDISWFLVVWM